MDPEGELPDLPTVAKGSSRPSPVPAPARGDALTPGTVLGERWRMVAPLGRGGMGEVWRAEDLRLGQHVALKFLPAAVVNDPVWSDRFTAEVRLARQVAHPNVCRVYDVGEADGRPFLSMEYVDGEDLATLVRRIGRLPAHKALQIARELCAGLGAAHARGVLHRDLKPANVMIDGQGRVRLTDFGLATAAEASAATAEPAGTPAYMAPELFAGRPPTVQSDLYALGLVLYELFTGRRAVTARTLAEAQRAHADGQFPAPTTVAPDLDVAVERAIQHCLDADPRSRPASAASVAASLPGGDALSALVAAGETPSPEMVAAAGPSAALQPRQATALLAAVIALLALASVIVSPSLVLRLTDLEKPPEVLRDRARELLRDLGHPVDGGDEGGAFGFDGALRAWVATHDPSPRRWRFLSAPGPSALFYWYRHADTTMVPWSGARVLDAYDPPLDAPGSVRVVLDHRGRLHSLLALPGAQAPRTVPPDWKSLIERAGFDPARLAVAVPEVDHPVPHDQRVAFIGTWPGRDDLPVRIEAAARANQVVAFHAFGPWEKEERGEAAGDQLKKLATALTDSLVIVLGALLARANLFAGRGDRAGAWRLARIVLALRFAQRMLEAHPRPAVWWTVLPTAAGDALVSAAATWILYLALEPAVRRSWPAVLVSWTRALRGRPGDPIVGRDLLLGLLAGGAALSVLRLAGVLLPLLGIPAPEPDNAGVASLGSLRRSLAELCDLARQSVYYGLACAFLLASTRRVLTAALLWIPFVALFMLGGGSVLLQVPFALGASAILFAALLRVGVLAVATAVFAMTLLSHLPLSSDLGAWNTTIPMAAHGALLLVAVAAWRSAQGRGATDSTR